jgi:hypothetical protein
MRDDLDPSTDDPEAPAERAPATAARRRAERASAALLRRLHIHHPEHAPTGTAEVNDQ